MFNGGARMPRGRLPRLLAAAAWLCAWTGAADAEFPASLNVAAGLGFGVGRVEGDLIGPIAGIGAVDVSLHPLVGRRLFLSAEVAGAQPLFGGYRAHDPFDPVVDAVHHEALLLGVERAKGRGGGYHQLGVGVGRLVAERGRDRRESVGLALSASAGIRVVPKPGPVGLLFVARTGHVLAPDLSGHALAGMLGLTFDPR